MSRPPPPLRFLGGILLLWIAGRIVALQLFSPADRAPPILAEQRLPAEWAAPVASIAPVMPREEKRAGRITPPLLARTGPLPRRAALSEAAAPSLDRPLPALPPESPALVRVERAVPAPLAPTLVPAEPRAASRSRWSGDAYVFLRPGGRAAAGVAAGAAGAATLGGSQMAARIAYALRDGPPRLAAVARLYVPLGEVAGSEGAVGIDWHPFPKTALRLAAERRFDAGGKGRDAWAAYAAGGAYKGGLPGGLEADLYAQAGVVGARRNDLFVDGALRLARPLAVGPQHVLRLGAGAWGAAQPDAARLDVGPRIALGLPVGPTHVTAALEYRARLHGNAAPRSGYAFTLATDF